MAILTNIFFWLFVVGFIGALFSLRLAGLFRERAVFAELPEEQYAFELRTKIFYAFFTIFVLAGLSGLGITASQFIASSGISLPNLISEAEESLPVLQLIETVVPTPPAESSTPVPPPPMEVSDKEPLLTPNPSSNPIAELLGLRVIGNTNYQGVNLRERPGLDAAIVAKLKNNTQVWLIDTPEQAANGYTWQQVQLQNGTAGWIVSHYLLEKALPFDPMNP